MNEEAQEDQLIEALVLGDNSAHLVQRGKEEKSLRGFTKDVAHLDDNAGFEKDSPKEESLGDTFNRLAPPEIFIAIHNSKETDATKVPDADKLVEVMTNGEVRLYNKAKTEEGCKEAALLFWKQLEMQGKMVTEFLRDRAIAITMQSIYIKSFLNGVEALKTLELPQEIKANLENLAKQATPWADRVHLNTVMACMVARTPIGDIVPTVPGWYVFFYKDGSRPLVRKLVTPTDFESAGRKFIGRKTDIGNPTHWSLLDPFEVPGENNA